MSKTTSQKDIAVIGGGPGGLMAAERVAAAGLAVTVYERKPAPGRKFLLAGRGGLNLTHSEDLGRFMSRYGDAAGWLRPAIEKFPPSALRAWCEGLGEPTFVGSSGRVFPKSFKAAPLLRAWRARLEKLGVRFVFGSQWTGWDDSGNLVFSGADGLTKAARPAATILALGGASWPRLGADGAWAPILREAGIPVMPLLPANCGFTVQWSEIFRRQQAGQPVKPVTLSLGGEKLQGEMMITEKGVEGGIVYAFSSAIRNEIIKSGAAVVTLDLRPGIPEEELALRLAKRGALSFSNILQKAGGLSPVAAALTRETGGKGAQSLSAPALAAFIKNMPLRLDAPFPLDRAISTAGGVALDAVDGRFMLAAKPGVFVAGEMLDWEAPTGGYLLQATFSTAVHAAEGAIAWVSG
jgi:uncharacterized flavoprotein (TIGR03862 family)